MFRVVSLRIDESACGVCRACVEQCPEVFEDHDGQSVPTIRADAPRFFASHTEQIALAAEVCCVEAVLVEVGET
jgi:ferredoxin